MGWILNTYLEYKDWIELTKDAVFLAGAITLMKILWHKRFTDRAKAIKENLEFRDRIESNLNDYVREKAKNKVSIAVRFVHWKNYPHNLNNDAFPHRLFIYPHEDNVLPSRYIDNTGINFEEPIWWLSNSTYVDKNGIFFFAPKGQSFPCFKEFPNTILMLHLPFANIVNFDFREFIEYEPVFYIRHPYKSWKKLYDDDVFLRNKAGEDWLNVSLGLKNMMIGYSKPKYLFFKLKAFIRHFCSSHKKDDHK
jgi:hypothetical protein